MATPQEVIEGLAERLAQMIKAGTPHNNAIVTLVNDLESKANIDRKSAAALVDLALEAYANKYENKSVFNEAQLKARIDFLIPDSPQSASPIQSEFDKL